MSQSYTITGLFPKAVWENDSNKGDYTVNFEGLDDEVLIFHDASKDFAPPKVGDEVYGEVGPAKGRSGAGKLRFSYKPRPKSGGGSSTAGGGGGTRWTPEKERSVVRQHSQEMAIRFIAATGDAKDLNLEDADTVRVYLGRVKRLTDWFAKDATPEGNGAAVVAPPNGGGGEVPADTAGLAPAPAGVGDDIPF